MNQILSTENNNKSGKKRNKRSSATVKDIGSIAKFFAIALIIFGIFLVATSSYAWYKKESEEKADEQRKEVKATVRIEPKGEDKALITVIHDEAEIAKVEYYWQYGNVETIDGKNRKYMQMTVDVPAGENVLTVIATDSNGNKTKQTQEFVIENSSIQVEITQSKNNVKISATTDNELKTITYSWDEEEEKTIEINGKEYSMEIEAILGEHDLKVVVTDTEGNEEEKIITVKGTTKPTATIEAGNDCYLIKAHDDIGLSRVVIETVEDGKLTTMESDGKDFEFEFPLKDGSENYIKVTAYNKYGVASKTRKAVWKK